MAVVCADLGISTSKGHSLRRQLALPDPIRERIAERPAGDQLSVRMAHRLADMHDIAPELTEAVAERVTTSELHDHALRDLGGFVHRTVVEDERVYAVRIDDGALLDAAEQIEYARNHLTPSATPKPPPRSAASPTSSTPSSTRSPPAPAAARSSCASTRRCATAPRTAATAGCSTAARTSPPASGSSTPCSCSTPSASSSPTPTARPPARRPTSAARASTTRSCATPPKQDRQRRAAERARHAEATASNLGLGHDIRAALADPSHDQLSALREIVCRLLCEHHPELIAYGAGWTDAERQQPVGDTGRREPRHVDAIVDAELRRALDDPDPLHGIAQLVARWGAAFLLDPDGVTRTKALGSERIARKLRDALPGGEQPLRAALWAFMRPILSPRLVELNKDAFVFDAGIESGVDLDAHRADSSLDELDLDDERDAA